MPVVCLSGSLNSILMVRQNWTAAPEKTAGRPGLPSRGANRLISLSNQINCDPHLLGEAV